MSWVTIIWSMELGVCAMMMLVHLVVWSRNRNSWAHLCFSVIVLGVMGLAACEMIAMKTESPAVFGQLLRWAHVVFAIGAVGSLGFVHFYFGTGRWRLLGLALGLRLLAVVANFTTGQSLHVSVIHSLQHVSFLGEQVSILGEWVPNPWVRLGQFATLILLAYVVDASIRLWRTGSSQARRRAITVGGSLTFFFVVAMTQAALVATGTLRIPFIVSFPFLGMLVAMATELGSDLFRAGQVAQRLQDSEAALRESEERFRTMADAAPVLLWMSGKDKLCTFFNKAWLEFTGRKMEQELGNGWAEGVHADDFEECLKTYVTAFEARAPFVMQYRLKRHDGEYRWLTDQGVPRYGPRGDFRGYIGACVDITDLLKQKKALHEIEERVALAAEAAHLGVWEMNTATNEVWVSDKVRELFEFEREVPITYEDFQGRVHPEDRAARDAAMQKTIETKGSYDIEFRVLLADGTVRWIGGRARCISDENGALTRLLGVSMDVTGRKRAEESVAQLSQRNQLILNAAAEGILGLDLQGNHTFVNAAAARMLGYESEELIGRHSHSMWHHTKPDGSPYPIEECNIYAAYRDGTVHHVSSEVFWRKDHTSFPVEYSSTPLFDQGRLVGAVVTFMDISARKAAEQEAQRHRDQVDLLSRVSLLGEMTASLAHELNQPLSAIVSNANAGMRFLDKGRLEPDTLREILVDVIADGRRAHEIIQRVRGTIKKGDAIRQRTDLNDVVLGVAHIVRSDASASSCQIETFLAKDLAAIEVDPIQIQQVLVNLVSNAIDAMRQTPVSRRKVQITTSGNGDEVVCVSVRDHGTGIEEEARARLFEQFFTTKEEGLGMGLAIVRSIVESHGGEIAAENVDEGGARFYFTLPVSKDI